MQRIKRAILLALALVVGAFTLHIATASATGDNGHGCPPGTTFEYKVEPLSGYTFTVPTPPPGWTVTAVILKVGGPGGGTHITFAPVTPGQVLSVANQQYAISHADICKAKNTTTTTTTQPGSTSSTSSTSTSAPSTTQPTVTSTTTSTTVVPESPTTTSTAVSPTSTSAPSTNPPDPPAPSTTVEVADPPVPPPTNPEDPPMLIPATL